MILYNYPVSWIKTSIIWYFAKKRKELSKTVNFKKLLKESLRNKIIKGMITNRLSWVTTDRGAYNSSSFVSRNSISSSIRNNYRLWSSLCRRNNEAMSRPSPARPYSSFRSLSAREDTDWKSIVSNIAKHFFLFLSRNNWRYQ